MICEQTLTLQTAPGQMIQDLKAHLALCEEALVLASRENQVLSADKPYAAEEYSVARKSLLPRLEQSLIALRKWRETWCQSSVADRAGSTEVGSLFQAAQNLLMKVLLLDRENQQALLRRGLVPPRHLPVTPGQQPHYVADAYRRHSRG